MAKNNDFRVRNYFLNERHLLSPKPKSGGGGNPKFDDISWGRKAETISLSIKQVTAELQNSEDPLKDDRFFALVVPETEVKKLSTDRKKAPSGVFDEITDYSGDHSKSLERLGLDLLEVSSSGTAIIHGEPNIFEHLLSRSRSLESVGIREQAKWATINHFGLIPTSFRINFDWLNSLSTTEPSDVVFELQPLVNKVEANKTFRSINDLLNIEGAGKLISAGVDFSGRFWARGSSLPTAIRSVAEQYFSVQSIHAPLFSYFFNQNNSVNTNSSIAPPPQGANNLNLPCVAVLDTGSPSDHSALSPFRRGQFIAQGAMKRESAEHGSHVATRIVFGDCTSYDQLAEQPGECSFYDVVVADALEDKVDDKLVVPALSSVRGAAPDVRVFNLSFGSRESLAEMNDIVYRERLIELEELDNFAFANDSIIVVAAGNSNFGVTPSVPYPNHHADPRWALGAWACGYNTLVCGSHVPTPTVDGTAGVGYPSPFSRIGLGINDAPVPSFSSSGGNCNDAYQYFVGGGVPVFGSAGFIEEQLGTSLASPLLAREAALMISALKQYCPSGSEPSAVLVRACLATFAKKTTDDPTVQTLYKRTLGFGQTNHLRIKMPIPNSAVLLWQGVLDSSRDILRVKIPVPKAWLTKATNPQLRLCVCYDTPVNHVAVKNWACRKVDITIRTEADSPAIRGGVYREHPNYPLFFRILNLNKAKLKNKATHDFWVMELRYEEISPYPPGNTFDPQQKVAVVAELEDLGENPTSAHSHLQALPYANELNLLSANGTRTQTPVMIRNR